MTDQSFNPTDRRALLAGIGGLAAGTFLGAGRAEAGPLVPSSPPGPTGKPLSEVEPRIAVNAANTPGDGQSVFRISQPGSYYLTGNVSAVAGRNGIIIAAHGVTLDLMGFALLGDPLILLDGINVSGFRNGLVIRNGSILNWGSLGIRGRMDGGSIENIHFAGNRDGAFRNAGGFAARVAGCTAYGNGGFSPSTVAIFLGEAGVADGCIVRSNQGIGISGEDGCQIINCSVVSNVTTGIRVGRRCIVHSNAVSRNGVGIDVANDENRIEGNQSVGNTTGLRVTGANNHVEANVVRGNTTNYSFVEGNHLNILLSQIPETIAWPASVKLAGSLTGVSGQHGITITSSNVTIDLNGHSLLGVAGSLDGIRLAVSELEDRRNGYIIRNGSVSGWDGNGINMVAGTSPRSTIVEGVNAVGNGGIGIRVCPNSVVRGCTAFVNGGSGIASTGGVTVENCAARSNTESGFFLESHSSITNCTSQSNTQSGFTLGAYCTGSLLNAANNRGVGINLQTSGTLSGCNCRENNGTGIAVNSHSLVTNCTSNANGQHGISVSASCVIRDNQANDNGTVITDSAGIQVTGTGNRIERNTSVGNRRGIRQTFSPSFYSQNICRNNSVNNWVMPSGNVCLTLTANTASTFTGDSGGASPGSTNPHANYTF